MYLVIGIGELPRTTSGIGIDWYFKYQNWNLSTKFQVILIL